MDALENNRKYREARKKAREIRGFYIHLTVYCIAIPIAIASNLIFVPEFYWFPFTVIGWGLGLTFHGFEVFGVAPFMGRNWEEKKTRELLNQAEADVKVKDDAKAPDYREVQRYEYARKRAKKISGFYKHFGVYVIINLFSIGSKAFEADSMGEFFSFSTFSLAFFWGIGLALHAFNTFGIDGVLGNDWEERKIREYMEKDKQTRQKWE